MIVNLFIIIVLIAILCIVPYDFKLETYGVLITIISEMLLRKVDDSKVKIINVGSKASKCWET